jgi:hypothetical protein
MTDDVCASADRVSALNTKKCLRQSHTNRIQKSERRSALVIGPRRSPGPGRMRFEMHLRGDSLRLGPRGFWTRPLPSGRIGSIRTGASNTLFTPTQLFSNAHQDDMMIGSGDETVDAISPPLIRSLLWKERIQWQVYADAA